MRSSWPTAASIPIRRRAGNPTGFIARRRSSFPNRTAGRTRLGAALPARSWCIYELHVGAFTPEGTLDAIIPRLPQLLSLGVTAIELMPVAQFPGERNWGYDAVYPYAVQNSYGGPRALQRLVDAAHQAGLAVILDVVYNHLGPKETISANYGPYFTDHYRTPWGMAVNYDGPQSDAVRQFVIDNAGSGCAISTSTVCGSMRFMPSTTSALGTSSRRFKRPCNARRLTPVASSMLSPKAIRTMSAWSVRASAAAMGWTACGATIFITAFTRC